MRTEHLAPAVRPAEARIFRMRRPANGMRALPGVATVPGVITSSPLPDSIVIRPLGHGGAEAFATLFVAIWREAYRVLMPADRLAPPAPASVADRFREVLADPSTGRREETGGTIEASMTRRHEAGEVPA